MKTITIKCTALQAGEIAHKLCILRDEPDLLESYEVTQAQAAAAADLFLAAQPGGLVTFASDMVDAILGELDNSVEIAQANLEDSGDPIDAAEHRGYIGSIRGAQRKIRAALELTKATA